MLQAVLFLKSKWSTKDARNHLKKEKLKPIKRVHTTDKYHRYRITTPNYDKYDYIIKRGLNDIDYIIGIEKKN